MQLYQLEVWVLAGAILSRRVDNLHTGGSAEQDNFIPYYVIKILQVLHSYVRTVGI